MWVAIPAVDSLSDASLAVRIGLVAAGILLFGVGSAFYIGAGMGAGPRDSMMLVLTRKSGWRIGIVRGAIEITVLIAGLLLGGTAGITWPTSRRCGSGRGGKIRPCPTRKWISGTRSA